MAKFYTELKDGLKQFIAAQHVFFNASAPNEGRINLSPKGLDTFRILSDKLVAYLDLTGSENETAAHVAENGRLTLMFCSFEDKPSILRLYGKGRVMFPRDPEWQELHPQFPTIPGERQIVLLEFKGQRSLLPDWSCKMGEERLNEYRHERNLKSIDGLPTYLEEPPTT
jgi:hypothetical protein